MPRKGRTMIRIIADVFKIAIGGYTPRNQPDARRRPLDRSDRR
jgi:hypothetical protein